MPSFKQNVLLVITCIIYIVFGVVFQEKAIIVHPAYWTLYGAIFGIVISSIFVWDHIKDD